MVSSFRTQYGMRLRGNLSEMPWEEFCDLLSGLGADTPLGKIVGIRSENDREVLKHFTPEQRCIRSEWQRRTAKTVSAADAASALEQIRQALIEMAGGAAQT
ncbi:MAG: Gp15 family bacteriophage protein [Eubacteriales bacterium]|nr:Gp15 family bacteriophage protein [Eubacteriales bacterium]